MVKNVFSLATQTLSNCPISKLHSGLKGSLQRSPRACFILNQEICYVSAWRCHLMKVELPGYQQMVVGKQHIHTMGVGTLSVDGSFTKLDASWKETIVQNGHIFTVLFEEKNFCCLN
uniref:Uncharacterized protein n=1 Tax=Micrurus spixii TaxID=129469 RepID=A0A2D4NB71_9SAUR